MANGIFFQKQRIVMTWIFATALFMVILFSGSYCENRYLISDLLFVIGAALVGLATVGRLWCSLYISGYKGNTLITTGPYSMCRNPLYLFSLLGAVGVGLTSETLVIPGIILTGFVSYYSHVIKEEERQLSKVHGDAYRKYCKKTPKFLPSFSLFNEPQEYTVKPKVFRKNIFHALWFVWLVGILEVVEALHESGVVPIFLKLY